MFKELDKLVDQGYLRKFEDDNLIGYNYTEKTVYERKWNKYTLNNRGTVYNKTNGKVIARPFPKFFNLSELSMSQQRAIINETGVYNKYVILEKIDGSLGIIYYYGGKWRVNTRGSFNSDQAVKGEELLNNYSMKDANKNLTYLVEIIYPENKIIVNYGDIEELRLIGVINTRGNFEYSWEDCKNLAKKLNMPVADEYNITITDALKLQKSIPKDEEGFVVWFNNNTRVKIKGDDYMRMSRIIKNLSPLAVWEKLKNGKVCNKFLHTIPEEFNNELNKIVFTLENNYDIIKQEIYKEVEYIKKKYNKTFKHENNDVNKQVGLYIRDYRSKLKHPDAIFIALNNKDLDKYINKRIRPKGNSFE